MTQEPLAQQDEQGQEQQQHDYMADYVAHAWDIHGQLPLLIFIAAILGLGKGGVPAIATIATALTVLTTPTSSPGALSYAVALQVPILCMIDASAAWLHSKAGLNWHVICILTPFAYIGMFLGQVIDRHVSDDMARVMVGSILLLILGIQLIDGGGGGSSSTMATPRGSGGGSDTIKCKHTDADNNHDIYLELEMESYDHNHIQASSSGDKDDTAADIELRDLMPLMDNNDKVDSVKKMTKKKVSFSLQSVVDNGKQQQQQQPKNIVAWGVFVGLIGGAATMMTNSMGPLLNVYLLSIVQLSPASYIGTRAMFFCIINLGKLPMRLASGTLGVQMLPLAGFLGLISVAGVVAAKPIMLWLNPKTFVKLELAVVAFAGVRLCWMGLAQS